MTLPCLERLVPEHIRCFEPYIPSKPDDVLMKMYGCKRLYRLNNNENPLGPPPAAQRALEQFPPPRAAVYPSGDAYHLRCRLAEELDLDPDQILVGNGANEVITFVIKAFCQQDDNIVTADKTFAVYEWVAEFSGCRAKLVPLKDFGFDHRSMLAAVDRRTKIIFICNPNNPTGSYWSRQRLEGFLEAVGGRRIVVLDEAYCEFVQQPDYPDGIRLIDRYPNLVVFRTFSKMYALAGLRIGYLAGSRKVVDVVRRTCVVYSVNGPAQVAALACIGDRRHIRRTRQLVSRGKEFLLSAMEQLNLPTVAGEGNFIMVKLPINDNLAYRKLMSRGVMVRSMTGFRFPGWIRVSIGRMEALEAFARSLAAIIEESR